MAWGYDNQPGGLEQWPLQECASDGNMLFMTDFTAINRFNSVVRRQILKGKSLSRALMNVFASKIEITGRILDLGSKSNAPSYHRFLKLNQPYAIECVDLTVDEPGIIRMDLEKPFPVPSGEYDTILCFNLLEHVYDTHNVISESRRVLKKGGKVVGAVPFLVRYHADPHDYHRYTHEALERIAREVGFTNIQIVPLGLGPFSASISLVAVFMPGIIRFWLHANAAIIDYLLFRKKPLVDILGYGFIFE